MSALDDLTSSVVALDLSVQSLGASVDAAVSVIQTGAATDAQLLALKVTTDGLKASVDAQVTKLNDAVNPPTPPTP